MSTTPFVVGQWVRGERFYGRKALIQEILYGQRNWLWLLGTRRIGKTSLLRQIEHLTIAGEQGFFPLFWDFQGSSNPRELHAGFHDALLDAEDGISALGIRLDQVEDDDLFLSVGKLRRQLRARSRKLLLLCDEIEELIRLNEKDPTLLGKLRRVLQSPEDIRSVLASTIRLWMLSDQQSDTSPFLHGFTPPLYIHNLSDDEARELIAQANLPDDSRPRFDERMIESIRSHCDNHPYLIQLLGRRCMEIDDLEEAIEQVASDPMVSYFFSVDFDMLTENEKEILRVIADQDASTSGSIQKHVPVDSTDLGTYLHRLEHLGYVHKDPERRYLLANFFFRRWFCGPRRPVTPQKLADAPGPPAKQTLTSTLSAEPQILDDRYELLEKIGMGAQGVVHKAHDRLLHAVVAIKVLRADHVLAEEALDRVRREILLARDVAHPNVVRVYHLGQSQGKTYIIMQWIDGQTLAKVISQTGPLPIAWARNIAEKTAGALEAAHAVKVLHRDIKTSNILMDKAGEPHLSDFGLARLLEDASQTSHGVFLGTPDYASPEQANNRPLDERSDIYSLGVVMFEMITGKRPFVGRSVGEVLEFHRSILPPDPETLRPDVPRPLSRIVLSCLEKDPAKRPQRAADLRAALMNL
jgi:tRNA A-37 threonylcarbamoyl transferase component Bud32